MIGNTQVQSLKQFQKVNTQQIQFLNFLFQNQQELDNHINQELLENPFLEKKEDTLFSDSDSDYQEDASNDLIGEMRVEEVFSNDTLDQEPNYKLNNALSSQDNSEWQDLMLQRHTEEENLCESIYQQIQFLNLTTEQLEIAHFIINSTNEKGFLDADLYTISDNLGFATGKFHSESEIQHIKNIVNICDPVGFACFDLNDYFLVMLANSNVEDKSICDLGKKIILDYFEDFKKGNWDEIANNLNIENEKVLEILSLIHSFKPFPTYGFGNGWSSDNSSIIPDYEVFLNGVELKGQIISINSYNLKVNAEYANSLKSTSRDGTNSYISSKLKSAHWLIDAIQQREETMTKVIETIVYLQNEYLQTGDIKALKPMILKDVASLIGMDISTVSRVTSNKYARTPIGLVNLKDMFSEGIYLDNGDKVSNREVQDLVLSLLNEEDKTSPYSDLEICKILEEKGISLTRRTITKYRLAGNVPSSKDRKTS